MCNKCIYTNWQTDQNCTSRDHGIKKIRNSGYDTQAEVKAHCPETRFGGYLLCCIVESERQNGYPSIGQGDSLAGPSLPVVVADETTLQASQKNPNNTKEKPDPSIPTPSLDSTPQTT